MHRHHLIGCAIAIVLALGVVVFTGGSSTSLGVLVAVLACPIAMVVALRLLVGPGHRAAPASRPSAAPEAELDRR